MKAKLILTKRILDYDLFKRLKGCPIAVPTYDKDRAALKIINGDFYATIRQPRNMKLLAKYWILIDIALDNGALDKVRISKEVVKGIVGMCGSESEGMHYILKWLFLPHKVVPTMTGQRYETVQSVAIEEMDDLVFQEYFKKCEDYICSLLDCTTEQIWSETK